MKYLVLSLILCLTACSGGKHVVEPTQIAGPKGESGSNGENGYTTLFKDSQVKVDDSLCLSKSAVLLEYGLDLNRDFELQTSEVTDGAVICHGANGEDGDDGQDLTPSDYDIVEVIDPCGNETSFDEVLIRLHDDTILAHFDQEPNQFLTILDPGNYVTTDGTNCHFKVTSSMDVIW